MPDLDGDLRSTEASISRDADRIKELEREKASLDSGDPRVDRLSKQVEQIAVDLRGKAAAERELADRIGSDEDRRHH